MTEIKPEPRKVLVVENSFITVPVPQSIQTLIEGWIKDHYEDLRERMADVGYEPADIAIPTFERLVTLDEVQP